MCNLWQNVLTDELTSLSKEIDGLSARNARTEANLSEELSVLEGRYNEKRGEYDNVIAEIDDKKTRAVIVEKFLNDLSEIKEPLKEWDMSDILNETSESLLSNVL